jgi:hypothetical protein
MAKRSTIALTLLMGFLSLSAQELKLFSPKMRDAASYPHQVVMDFLERYFGNELPALKQTTLEHKMADDKVYFRKGKLQDMYHLTDTMPFSISLLDKYYEVKWEPVVTVVFPAQYDLLLGMEKDEAQNRLKETILAAPDCHLLKEVPSDLSQLSDGIWQSKSEYFELESLNDAIYYNKVREDYQPVFDSSHLEYSAANLFHGLISNADYRMYVEQSVYGIKTITYTLSLHQWLNYCSQLGMKVYFAVEEQRGDGLLAIVVAQSRELGFNHLLSVVIPDKFVTDKNAVLKVRLSPYIPTHNVKNLYQKESAHHKKKTWQ